MDMHVLSLFVKDQFHIIDYNRHFVWKPHEDENKNETKCVHQFDVKNTNSKTNRKLFYLKSKNILIFINGFDNLWSYSFDTESWTKWDISRRGKLKQETFRRITSRNADRDIRICFNG